MSSGLCFPYATREARVRGGEVVHALVTNPATGDRFWHAWVERGGKVYDDVGHRLSVGRFREMFRPEEERRYSAIEALVYSLRTGHHGPWEPGETGAPPKVRTRTRSRRVRLLP